ncbi:hypothetical protein D2E83_16135 [Mycobacteroides abscessus]|nr:hypothetical protein D2E83_16135 [Mycobacteroides abscessus]
MLITTRLAAASQCFPLPHSDVDGIAVRDSTVYVEADGNVITVCVTDYDGSKREYRANVRLASLPPEMSTTPAESGAGTPGRGRCNQLSIRK